MQAIRFDFNNMFSFNIGKQDGVTQKQLGRILSSIRKADLHLKSICADKQLREELSLEWVRLPYQQKRDIRFIQNLGRQIASRYKNVLFLGIGGSYLGIKAAQDALLPAYYNEFSGVRSDRPRIYFEGNNLDADTLSVLLKNLDPGKTFLVVISKSGETTETKAAFLVAEKWLKAKIGPDYGRQIIVITDPVSGSLRKRANLQQARHTLGFRSLPLLKGVGGRFSELNMGLLHLAICGLRIEDVLKGASDMALRCSRPGIFKNPAYLYAALHYLLYRESGKDIGVLMPFSERLKSTADWYVQLLAESLGKKYPRIIKRKGQGRESWGPNTRQAINVGRTPVSCRGTGDLHSIQQNSIEGENNKCTTFIRVDKFSHDLEVPSGGGILSKRLYSELISLAHAATEWALVQAKRPNCTISLPEISPYYWGGLLFFFEMATAVEGELLNVNAFDQPGVEGYKNYMYYKLGKTGIAKEITEKIKKNPLKKREKFII